MLGAISVDFLRRFGFGFNFIVDTWILMVFVEPALFLVILTRPITFFLPMLTFPTKLVCPGQIFAF